MYVLIYVNILKFKSKLNLKFMFKGSKTMKRMKRSKKRRELIQVKAIFFAYKYKYRYTMKTRKYTLKNIIYGCVVCSEHPIDIMNPKRIRKQNLHLYHWAIYWKDCFFLGFSKEIQKEPPNASAIRSFSAQGKFQGIRTLR